MSINRRKIITSTIGLVCCLGAWSQGSVTVPSESDSIVETVTGEKIHPDRNEKRMPQFSADGKWNRLFRLKTNALGWVFLISNLTGEMDLNENWSLGLEVDYSGMDYFSPKVKFRIFALKPEVRYWFTPGGGWYVGAHLGMAYWNFAFGGKYRYQDDWRRTPALGGGVSAGYRMPISKDGRWEMEFGLGIGIYRANHNRFANEKNGKLLDSVKKIYFGPDFIGLSFSYAFDVANSQNLGKGGIK